MHRGLSPSPQWIVRGWVGGWRGDWLKDFKASGFQQAVLAAVFAGGHAAFFFEDARQMALVEEACLRNI